MSAPTADRAIDDVIDDDAKPEVEQPDTATTHRWTPAVIALSALLVAAIVAIGVLSTLLAGKSSTVDDLEASAADRAQAEKVSLEYATAAASMNYKDLSTWQKALIKGTSPELSSKLSAAATSMEQVITPLQWTSTAAPIAAHTKSVNGNIVVTTAFVNVMTRNAQAPDGVQSTATYTVTLDKSRNWLITDVGGVDAPTAGK